MSRAVYSLSPGSKWCATRARGSLAHVGRLVRLPTRTVRGTGGDPPLMHVYGTLIDHTEQRPVNQGADQDFLGADDGIRTRDPHLGKVMLYQLSHVRSGRAG